MTFPVPGGSTFLRARSNLADLGSESAALINLGDYDATQQLAAGEAVLSRINVPTGAPLVSGTVALTYWTAGKTETCNTIIAVNGSTAAGATPTYAAMGVYSVDGAGNLTLAAQCASDTTLFASSFTGYSRALTAPLSKVMDQRYAFALLVVSAAAMPTPNGFSGTMQLANFAPRLAGLLAGQASLPASIAAGSITNTSSAWFGAVTP
jgi:hypothetical protein